MTFESARIQAEGTFRVPRKERSPLCVEGKLLSGVVSTTMLMRSVFYGDLWRIEEMQIFGAEPPNKLDTHEAGAYLFAFSALQGDRDIEEGEEFEQTDVTLPPLERGASDAVASNS